MKHSSIPQSAVNVEPGSFRVIVPTRNGGPRWIEAAQALASAIKIRAQVVVIDSESTDGSDSVARELGFVVRRIPVRSFNHGGTRQRAIEDFAMDREFAVFLTQDAVVENEQSIPRLLESFNDAMVGAAFGRQLPHTGAKLFEAHAAMFNYGPRSSTRTISDAARLGIKTAYFSNSFAAYRLSAILRQGGFPSHLILGEDVYVAAKMLMAGLSIRYCAEARVHHSHDYTTAEECRRYFDFGVMHAQIPELLSTFGTPEGEGLSFLASELKFAATSRPVQVPSCILRNAAKYVAYRLGRIYRIFPPKVTARLSMTKGYWTETGPRTP